MAKRKAGKKEPAEMDDMKMMKRMGKRQGKRRGRKAGRY